MLRDLLAKILDVALGPASEFVRAQLVEFVEGIEAAALATDNPYDDDLVAALKKVLGIS